MPRMIVPSDRVPRTENIFRALLGFYEFGNNCHADDEGIMVEVLTDIRFLCEEYGGIFDRCNEIAAEQYNKEKAEGT